MRRTGWEYVFPYADKILYDEDSNKMYLLLQYISQMHAKFLKISDRLCKSRTLVH